MDINEIIKIVLLFGILTLCAYSLYKVRKVHLMQFSLQNQFDGFPATLNLTYKQIQAFIALDQQLGLSYALPPLRGWAASPDFLLALAEHVKQNQPKVVVECSSGSSTIVIAKCLKNNGEGHVYSLEHESLFAEKTKMELKKQGLEEWATVVDASLIEYKFNNQGYSWYQLDEDLKTRNFDMLVIDGPPKDLNPCSRFPAGPLLLPLLNISGKVFLDDADRVDEKIIVKQWLESYANLDAMELDCEKGAVVLTNRG